MKLADNKRVYKIISLCILHYECGVHTYFCTHICVACTGISYDQLSYYSSDPLRAAYPSFLAHKNKWEGGILNCNTH